MALHLPPAVSVDRFQGGYKAVSIYTDLGDTETNDAKNCVYGPNGAIDQRAGSLRLLNSRLTATSATAGEPITGHYYWRKLGQNVTFHVVAAGDALYNYNSSTATRIRSGLTDNSNTFWSFTQIRDPRAITDEIILATNGVEPIQVWDGTATASHLVSFTSAASVPVGKYILSHKERIYVGNLNDPTDANATVKVALSGFGADGLADPHRFTPAAGGGSFYCGGAGKQGDLRGLKLLNDQIICYTRKSVWKFDPGTGSLIDTSSLQEMQEAHGLLAPFSLVDVGGLHVFLSEQGVYAFDGVNFKHLSQKVDEDLLRNSTLSQLQYAKAVYYKRENQYVLYYASGDSVRNDTALVYDLRLGVWQPPITGRRVSYLSTYDTSDGIEEVIYGDYSGYLYQDHIGINDGIAIGYNGSATSGSYNDITDSAADFLTTGDGLSGMVVRIIEGTGEDQERVIASNTSAVITIETPWSVPPDNTSKYTIGGIDGIWRSKDYDFGGHDILKLFRLVRPRVREEGNFNLIMHYIVDFKDIRLAGSRLVSLLENGGAFDVSLYDSARYDGLAVINRKVSLTNTADQRLNGTHMALMFSNRRANESFRLSGYDIEFKPLAGKR